MAQKVLVEMVDDIDGEVATQTVPFGLDGISYEIDLSEENAARLREELARFIAAAQRTGVRKIRLATGQSAARAGADRAQSRQIREWAREQGYGVSQRGRIPTKVSDAFEQAQRVPVVSEPVAAEPAKTPRRRATRKKAPANT